MAEKERRAIFNLDSDLYPVTVTGKNATEGELENGAFVAVGELEDSDLGRETYKLTKLTGKDSVIGFVSSPSLMYDEREDERDFVCAQDELIRTYIPNKSTVGTFALKHFENGSTLSKKDKLTPKANSTQLTKVNSTEPVVAVVMDKVDFEGQESLVIKFV